MTEETRLDPVPGRGSLAGDRERHAGDHEPVGPPVREGPVSERRIAVADGVELRVLDRTGSGPAFVLVHGLASNARLWDDVGDLLSAAGHRSVAVDLRGHGLSSKPDAGYDFATIADDLKALVSALGLERPVLVGQSWGASVVLETALRHPGVASAIALVDGGVIDLADEFASWESCRSQLAPPLLIGTPAVDIERYLRGAHPDWPVRGIQGSLANFEVRPDGTVAPWLSRDHHFAILRALWEERPSRLLAGLDVPALLIPADTGDTDWTAAKRRGVEAAEHANPRLRVAWLAGDHDLHAQHPAAVARLLGEMANAESVR